MRARDLAAKEERERITFRQAAEKFLAVHESKPASNIAEATVHAQIRDRLAALEKDRMAFLEKNAGDPVVASAILTAPSFLSGLNDGELAPVKHKVERHISPEIAEGRLDPWGVQNPLNGGDWS